MNRHVHIIGAPRSGTTLLLEVLRCCYGWDWAPQKETRLIDAVRQGFGFSLSKWPDGLVPRSYLYDPQNWLVFVNRDPRDIVCSRHSRKPELYWGNLAMWRLMRANISRFSNHPRFVVVSYEDLVADPDSFQMRLEERIPWLQRKARFSEFHVLAQPSDQSLVALHGVRPINRNSVGSWQHHRERLAGQLLLHGSITEELILDGYEIDDRWLNSLEDVMPDISPGHWPDKISRRKWLKHRLIKQMESAQLMLALLYKVSRSRQSDK